MDNNEKIPDDIIELAHEIEGYYMRVINNNSMYMVNPKQYDKLMRVIVFIKKYANEFGGIMDEINLIPNLEFVDITATVDIFNFSGEKELKEFTEMLKLVSNIGIYADLNGKLHISATVPECYVRIM